MINSRIKYFVIQSMGSIIFFFSIIFFIKSNYSSMIFNLNELIIIAIIIKIGIPPLHFWIPQIIEFINFFNLFILSTWQKIIPSYVLSLTTSSFIIIIIIFTAVVGSLGGINQNSLYKIIAYSSISHSAWLLIRIFINFKVWLIYFVSYTFIIIIFFWNISIIKINKISELLTLNYSMLAKVLFLINLIIIAGIPPFIGFLNKIFILNYSINNYFFLILIIIISASLTSIIFYFKIIFFLSNKNFLDFKTFNFRAFKVNFFNLIIFILINFLPLIFIFL